MQANKKSTLYPFPSPSCLQLTDEPIFWIQHYQCHCHCQCWQMPWFPELNIARVDKRADFWNSALSSLTDTLISKILHCLIFTKSNNPRIQHCWLFAEWIFPGNYIASFLEFLHSMSWIKESTLQTDNVDFLKSYGLSTTAMLNFWNSSFCV